MPKDKKAAPPRPKLKLVAAKPKAAAPKRRTALPTATVKAIIRRVMGELRKKNTAQEDGLDRLIRALKKTAPKRPRKKAG